MHPSRRARTSSAHSPRRTTRRRTTRRRRCTSVSAMHSWRRCRRTISSRRSRIDPGLRPLRRSRRPRSRGRRRSASSSPIPAVRLHGCRAVDRTWSRPRSPDSHEEGRLLVQQGWFTGFIEGDHGRATCVRACAVDRGAPARRGARAPDARQRGVRRRLPLPLGRLSGQGAPGSRPDAGRRRPAHGDCRPQGCRIRHDGNRRSRRGRSSTRPQRSPRRSSCARVGGSRPRPSVTSWGASTRGTGRRRGE